MKLKSNIASMRAYMPGKSLPGALKMSSNENPLGPSPKAIKAIESALYSIHRYPDGTAAALRQAIAMRWNTTIDRLIVTNGSDEAFSLLAAAWLAPGDNAVGMRQTFSQYRYAVNLFGAEMRETDLDKGRYDLASMVNMVDEHTRMLFVCNPNNPTGTYCSHDEIATLLKAVPPEVIVVLDEAYADFADAPDFPNSREFLEHYPNLVVVRTFSKLYGLAGLRIGYAIGNPIIIAGTERAAPPFNVNNLAQVAALAALDDPDHHQESVHLVHTEKTFMAAQFNKRGIFNYPSQANFVCFGIEKDAASLWTPIAKRGITVRDLTSFGLPKMIRYTYGRRENNAQLLAILDALK